jgi:hypothetical protein
MHDLINQQFMELCYGTIDCLIYYDPANFTDPDCGYKIVEEELAVYGQGKCSLPEVDVKIWDYSVERKYLGLSITICDLSVVAVFIIAIYFLERF